jgi:membrane protease YdiL (CAAX protease family)
LFGIIYLRSQRNLWITIIAHGLLNTIRFILVFTGNTG